MAKFQDALSEVGTASGDAERRASAFAWAQTIADCGDARPIGELLELDVPPSSDVVYHCETTRARNLLLENNATTVADICRLSVAEIEDWRGCGVTSVIDTLAATLRAIVPPRVLETVVEAVPVGEARMNAAAWARQLVQGSDRRRIGDLLALTAVPAVDVLQHCETTRSRTVLGRHDRTTAAAVCDLSISDLRAWPNCGHNTMVDIITATIVALTMSSDTSVPPTEPSLTEDNRRQDPTESADVVDVVAHWLESRSDREVAVVRHRIATRDKTLDELGERYGVTRERIRQIEIRLLRDLTSLVGSLPYFTAFENLSEQVLDSVGVVTSEARLLSSRSVLQRELAQSGLRLIDLLSVLIKDIEREDGWVAVRPLAELQVQTRDELLSPGTAADHDIADRLRMGLGLTLAEWEPWLAYCGLRSWQGQVVRSNASIPDLAIALLRSGGQPLSAEQVAQALGNDAVRSIRNRLLDDGRFVRVTPTTFALPEWGLETYEGIREEIVQRIDRAGGKALLSSITTELVEQFGVSANSVYAYAMGREFIRSDGWILLAGADRRPDARRSAARNSPEYTRRCFRHDGAWWFRVDVNSDTLRGSGFPAPIGVMSLFQLAESTERTLAWGRHSLRVSWMRPQPIFGTMRPILQQLAAREGDVVWIRPGQDDRLGRCCIERSSRSLTAELLVRSNLAAQLGL